MPRRLPSQSSLSLLKKQAKELRKALKSGQGEACERIRACHPSYADASPEEIRRTDLSLRDAQLVIAREYGFANWAELKAKVQADSQKTDPETLRAERVEASTSSEEEIARVIQAACGSPVQHSIRITEGLSNEVQWITTADGQDVMYRANWYCREPHFENEKWALEQCGRVAVPAPRVLYLEHGLPGNPQRSVCVTTRLEGESLKDLVDGGAVSVEAFHRLLTETGSLLGKLHGVRTEGFGRLDAHGRGKTRDWRSAYPENIDRDRLRASAHSVGLRWSLVEDALKILKDHVELGNHVQPRLLHGDWWLEHIIVHDGRVSGLIDFEFCEGGDPAWETDWSAEFITGWWDAFTGKESIPVPTRPLIDGYRQTGPMEGTFMHRSEWLRLWGGLGGLCHHGVNDVNTAGMMKFLNWRFREDLERANQCFG